MRVLVVDQDSAMLESIARSLGERYTVDAVTNKADCLDLLRQNTFEVIVAGERLEDGSGLELLSQAAKRWPRMLRIFSADRERLQLLKGRLGPFELFQTLTYPIDTDRLIATLELADAAQDANADTANIQHVVLAAEVYSEEPQEGGPFPAPKPESRAAPQRQDLPRIAPLRRMTPVGQPLRVGRGSLSSVPGGRSAVAVAEAPPPRSTAAPARRKQVQFPPVQPGPSSERVQLPVPLDSLAEAAEHAREASPALAPPPDEPEYQRHAVLIAISAAVALAVVLLALRTGGAHLESATRPGVRAQTAPPGTASQASASLPSTALSPPLAPVADAANSRRPAAPNESSSGRHALNKSAAHTRRATRISASAAEPARASEESASTVPVSNVASAATPAGGGPSPAASVANEPSLPPETPAGMTVAPAETLSPTNSAQAAVTSGEPLAVAPAGTSSATAAPPAAKSLAPTAATPTPRSNEPPPVVREARLIRRVNAAYPSGARRDGLKGSVDLDITVSTQGAVTDVTVTRSDPRGTFDKAAIAAVRRYRYDPRYVDGLPAEAHLQVHLDFDPGSESR